jgi:hypothetical protein
MKLNGRINMLKKMLFFLSIKNIHFIFVHQSYKWNYLREFFFIMQKKIEHDI